MAALQLYRPRRQGNRWLLRADVNLAGERLELQANASERLASRAASWWNRIAESIARRLGWPAGGRGVFADVPQVVATTFGSMGRSVVPLDDGITRAAKLYFAGAEGDPEAHAAIRAIYERARFLPAAAAQLRDLHLIEQALFERSSLRMREVLFDAAAGSPEAHRVLCALYQVSVEDAPTRLSWWVDDYAHCPERLSRDVAMAAGDEVLSRIVAPGASTGAVRRVAPGGATMGATWLALEAGGW